MIFSEDQFDLMEKQHLVELFKKHKDITIFSDEGKMRLYHDSNNIIYLTHTEYSNDTEEHGFIVDITLPSPDIKEAVSTLIRYYRKVKVASFRQRKAKDTLPN